MGEPTLLSPKARKWLDLIAVSSRPSGSMYRGQIVDLVPPKFARAFERSGWVDREIPHNPVHKERFVITEAGRAALLKAQGQQTEVSDV